MSEEKPSPKPRRSKKQQKIVAKGRMLAKAPSLDKEVVSNVFLPAAKREKNLYAKISKTLTITRTISELGRLTHEGREIAARSFAKCVHVLEGIALGKPSDGEIAARLIKAIRETVQLEQVKYGEISDGFAKLNRLADDGEQGIGGDAKDADKIAAINALGKYGLGERHDVNLSDSQTLEIFVEISMPFMIPDPKARLHWQSLLIDAMKNAKPGVEAK